ncbi:hypothetical protein [Gordonia sp. QH-12]|uniref:hypothetical protein n=1 Tax=Gordonia sp. QH-12 TaxID=1437876 RepID=UPI0012E738FA|nr:hypothetical protein [Gordonia sp. QH-12]
MSESNLPPERWRPYFDRAGIEFGYRPLAARAGLTPTRTHRLVRGGGTTDQAIQKVADALGVKASKVRELRGEPAVEIDPFILPDDAGRLNDTERDVVRRVVRALLDARDRHDTDQPASDADRPPASGTPRETREGEKNNVRDLRPDDSSRLTRRGRDFSKDPIVELPGAAYDGEGESESERARRLQDEQGEEPQE